MSNKSTSTPSATSFYSKSTQFKFMPFHWTFEDEIDKSNEIAQNIIRAYGWNELNESVYIYVEDFDIPIWIELPDEIEWTEQQIMKVQLALKNMYYQNGNNPTTIKRVYKEKLYYANIEKNADGKYSNKKYSFIEMTFRSLKAISSFTYGLKKKPLRVPGINLDNMKIHTAEPSITPVLKLLAIANLPSSSWINCKGIKISDEDKTSTKTHEYKVSWKNLKKMDDEESISMPIVYPKIMSFDNEAYSSVKGSMPNVRNPNDKVFMIGFTMLMQKGKDKEYKKYILSLSNPDKMEGITLIKYKTEADLYIGFSKLIRELDPDIIIGYNIFGWDIPYMHSRATELLRVQTEFENMSAVRGKKAKLKEINWESSAYGKQDLKYLEAEGRLFIDLLPYIKRNYKLSNYRLETVCEEILKDSNKDPLKAKDLFKIWEGKKPDQLAIVGKYCFVEGTKVSLKYRTENIENLKYNKEKVLSFDEEKNGLVYSEQSNFFNNGLHDCVEVELIDGSKITCTNDHKILLENNIWKDASKLILSDKVKCGLIFPYYNINEEFELCKGLDFSLFKILENKDMYKAYSLMRLLGYLMSDGYITKDRAELFIGCELDVKDILEDINIITNKTIKYRKQKNVFQVHLPMEITKYFLSLEGIVITKRKNSKSSIPSILKALPKCLIREFLGGLFGGDGHSPCFSKDKFTSLAFSQTINIEHKESLVEVLEEYKNMLKLFNIESNISNGRKPGGSSEDNVTVALNIPHKFMNIFEDNIGFRYCYHKSLRLRIACCYIKFKENKVNFYEDIMAEINDRVLINNESFSKAYKIVSKKYKEQIPTRYTFQARKDIGFKDFKFKDFPYIKASFFLKEIGAENLFKEDTTTTKKTYSVSRDADCIPSFFLNVKSVKNVGKKEVYDIEVKNTHTFVANGLVVHNCAQDTWVTLQIFEKALIWFDLVESATTNGVPMFYLYTKGQQIKMYAQVLKYCYYNNIIVQSNAYEVKDDENYTGAFVQEPKSGLYEYILPFDFASLYPSIIQAHNIDYSKLINDDIPEGRKIPDELCHIFDWEDHVNCCHDPEIILSTQRKKEREEKSIQKLIKEGMSESEAKDHIRNKNAEKAPPKEKKVVCGHFRYRFLKKDVTGNGVIPTLLTNLLKARKDTRKIIASNKDKIKELKKEGKNEEAENLYDINIVLDKRQNAYKVSANSMYGAMGVKKGYLPLLPGAMCVTAKGRESIKKASAFLENEYKANVIYNDTDSCYTYFPQLEGKSSNEIWDYAEGIVKHMVDISLFPSPMKLEFEEKAYVKFMILTKKRYCAYMMDRDGRVSDKMLIRGIALTRRDNCKFLRNVYEASIRYILNNSNEITKLSKEMEKKEIMSNSKISALLDLINDNVNDLFQRKYNYKDFVITQGLTKLEYKNKSPPAHFAVAQKMQNRGTPMVINTRIEYVIIDLMRGYDKKIKKFEKTEDMGYFNEHKEILRIDYLHYLESQGMVPLEELLRVCCYLEDEMEKIFNYRVSHNKVIYSLKKIFETRFKWVE